MLELLLRERIEVFIPLNRESDTLVLIKSLGASPRRAFLSTAWNVRGRNSIDLHKRDETWKLCEDILLLDPLEDILYLIPVSEIPPGGVTVLNDRLAPYRLRGLREEDASIEALSQDVLGKAQKKVEDQEESSDENALDLPIGESTG